MPASAYHSQSLRNLALDLKSIVRDPRVGRAIARGIEDFDTTLSELLRDHPAIADQAALSMHLDRARGLLWSQCFEPMLLGLPAHLAKTAAKDPARHQEDLGQLGVVALETTIERVLDFLSHAAPTVSFVGIVRGGYEAVKSSHPYKEALRPSLPLLVDTSLLLSGTPGWSSWPLRSPLTSSSVTKSSTSVFRRSPPITLPTGPEGTVSSGGSIAD